jgi:hypothetical protein
MTRTYPFHNPASGWTQLNIGTPGAPRIIAIEAPLNEALEIAATMTGPGPLASWRTTVEAEAAAAEEPDCVGGVYVMSMWEPAAVGAAMGPERVR